MRSYKRSLLNGAFLVSIMISALSGVMAHAGDYKKSDVDEQLKLVASDDQQERISAVAKIGDMGPIAEPATTQLIHLLDTDPSNTVRGACAKALGSIGPGAVSAVPSIIAFLKDKSWGYERTYAPMALGDIGLEADKSVPALLQAIKDDDDKTVRELSARAIGSFGARAQDALPELIDALNSGGKDMRSAAAYSVEKIPARLVDVPQLTALLKDEVDDTRLAAAKSIGGARADGASAVPQLVLMLDDKNWHVQQAAAIALGEIGPSAREAIPALKFAQKNGVIRAEVTTALKSITKR